MDGENYDQVPTLLGSQKIGYVEEQDVIPCISDAFEIGRVPETAEQDIQRLPVCSLSYLPDLRCRSFKVG